MHYCTINTRMFRWSILIMTDFPLSFLFRLFMIGASTNIHFPLSARYPVNVVPVAKFFGRHGCVSRALIMTVALWIRQERVLPKHPPHWLAQSHNPSRSQP